MKYKYIATQLLRCGVTGLSKWRREEFVLACMNDFHVCKRTAEKVYDEYHKAIGYPKNGGR